MAKKLHMVTAPGVDAPSTSKELLQFIAELVHDDLASMAEQLAPRPVNDLRAIVTVMLDNAKSMVFPKEDTPKFREHILQFRAPSEEEKDCALGGVIPAIDELMLDRGDGFLRTLFMIQYGSELHVAVVGIQLGEGHSA